MANLASICCSLCRFCWPREKLIVSEIFSLTKGAHIDSTKVLQIGAGLNCKPLKSERGNTTTVHAHVPVYILSD